MMELCAPVRALTAADDRWKVLVCCPSCYRMHSHDAGPTSCPPQLGVRTADCDGETYVVSWTTEERVR
jgi:hypothetical protein